MTASPLIIKTANIVAHAPCAVCVGTFDGVHIGHQSLLRETARLAEECGLVPVAHTFDTLPARVVRGDSDVRELTPLAQKARLMGACGVLEVAVSVFDRAMMRVSGEQFLDDVLIGALNARMVVMGFHHTTGYRGQTDANALCALCRARGVRAVVVPPVRLCDGRLVSSTAIRRALDEGDEKTARAMLFGEETGHVGGGNT